MEGASTTTTTTTTNNILVAVRVRPLSRSETDCSRVAQCLGSSSLCIARGGGDERKQFNFDYVYDESSTNALVFEDLGREVLHNAWLG